MKVFKMLLVVALQNSCHAFFHPPAQKRTYVPPLSSHFSVISTQITDKAILKKSLLDIIINIQYTMVLPQLLVTTKNK